MTFYGINYTTNLIAGQDIKENSIFTILLKIVLVVFAILILKHVLKLMNSGKKRKKMKKKTIKRSNRLDSPYRFKY